MPLLRAKRGTGSQTSPYRLHRLPPRTAPRPGDAHCAPAGQTSTHQYCHRSGTTPLRFSHSLLMKSNGLGSDMLLQVVAIL
jgi:hypothetical protein